MINPEIDAIRLNALHEAIRVAGGQSKLAEAVNKVHEFDVPKTQSHVAAWVNRFKKCPADLVLPIERATGVSRHRLRPDVFGYKPDSGIVTMC